MVVNDYVKDMVNKKFMEQIWDTINEITGQDDIEVDIISGKEGDFSPVVPCDVNKNALAQFLQKYSFDTFVVGKSNEFAYAVSKSVAQSPGRVYNPLFLYGGVGLGKTHLLQAIGRYVLENPKTKNLNVIYLSTEKFLSEMVSNISTNTMISFKEKYRKADILLLDDIQFLKKKQGLQEEFFHTFNTLYQENKQIIMSSDNPPQKIQGVEERLVSRFGMGLVADVQKPDIELRMAILRNKARQNNLDVEDKVIEYIASGCTQNIRQLEGAFIRILYISQYRKEPVDLAFAQAVLRDIIAESQRQITDSLIKKVVAKEYGISVEDLTSKQRKRTLSHPRQIAMYLCRNLTDMSLTAVGDSFGGKDHSTIIYAESKIKKEYTVNSKVREEVDKLIRIIKH
jgi:chromosomal replication initiator protein